MKTSTTLSLMAILITIGLTRGYGQEIQTVQNLTATGSVNGTAQIVYVTGTGPYTVTLTGASGRVITIVNHTSADLTISPAILVRKTGGSNTTSALLPANGSEFLSGLSGNTVRVFYNGTNWIKL